MAPVVGDASHGRGSRYSRAPPNKTTTERGKVGFGRLLGRKEERGEREKRDGPERCPLELIGISRITQLIQGIKRERKGEKIEKREKKRGEDLQNKI